MNSIALAILGVCLGHPGITAKEITGYPKRGVDMELESLDNAFDDAAYEHNWRPWDWEPGLCINCLAHFEDAGSGDCKQCGWLQGAA